MSKSSQTAQRDVWRRLTSANNVRGRLDAGPAEREAVGSLPMDESGDDPTCGHNKPSVQLNKLCRECELRASVAMIRARYQSAVKEEGGGGSRGQMLSVVTSLAVMRVRGVWIGACGRGGYGEATGRCMQRLGTLCDGASCSGDGESSGDESCDIQIAQRQGPTRYTPAWRTTHGHTRVSHPALAAQIAVFSHTPRSNPIAPPATALGEALLLGGRR
jgi:hypothetical protein